MTHTYRFILVFAVGLLAFAACAPVDPAGPLPEEPEPIRFTAAPQQEAEAPKTEPAAESQEEQMLRRRVEGAIRNVRRRTLMRTNAFWTIFHGILGLGPGVQIMDPQTRVKANALDYICDGGELRGLAFRPTAYGVEVLTLRDSQGQGHLDQFVAEMAQWGMPASRKIKIDGRDYTFMEFARHSQMRASLTEKQELSWTVIMVAQYFGTDASWTNANGEKLTCEDLVRYELAEPIEGAACGGTHRLFGLSWTYHLHLARGKPVAKGSVWEQVAEKTARYRDLARKYQNGDGSFSTRSFEGAGHSDDRQLRINTTGHIFEWLALALSDEELKSQWVENAASALSLMILDLQDAPIDSGSMYHAVHGLYLYHARRYGGTFAPKELMLPMPPGWSKHLKRAG